MKYFARLSVTLAALLATTLQALAINEPSVSYNSSTQVLTITHSDASAKLYYTVDGTDPTTSSYLYTAPLTVDRDINVRAIAVKGEEVSAVYNQGSIGVESRFLKDGIYYRKRPNTHPTVNELEVAPRESGSYTGDIVIPGTVTYAGTTYTVTRIGQQAFYDQDNVTSVTIPNTVDVIGYSAFRNMDKLTGIDIPASVKLIGAEAFYASSYITQVTLHEGLEQIDNSAFYYNTRLTSINLPSTLKSIGNNVFQDCSQLTSISIPDGVTSIGPSTFFGCYALQSAKLPAAIAEIPAWMFYSCVSLRSIDIPATVQTIGNDAFHNCDALTSVSLPVGVQTLGESVFFDCNNLLSVTIPEGVTAIPYQAFDDDYALTTVSLPSTLTTIGERAFNTCRSLTTITIPENVTSIAPYAFTECDKLTSVYALPSTPPTMSTANNGNAFYDCLERVTLYVKSADMANYTGSARWDEFQNKQAIDAALCEQPTFNLANYVLTMSTATTGATIYYTLDGSEPTTASTAYTAPIPFYQNATVRAIAVKDGMGNSAVSEFVKSNYTVANPVATMDEDFKVTITCEQPDIDDFPEVRVYYLIDTGWGNVATTDTNWKLYDGESIQLEHPQYVHVYAERDGWITSSQTAYNFYDNYRQETPSLNWYSSTKKVYVDYYNSYFANSTLHYTLDNTTPTADSPVYNPEEGIDIVRDQIVQVIALRDGYFPSYVGSLTITGVSEKFYVDGIYYRLRDNMTANEVEVTSPSNSNTKYSGDIIIPETVEFGGVKYAVTRIGYAAFYDHRDVTSITLPPSINSIGASAFRGCYGVTAMDIPANVTTIETQGLAYMSNLKQVTLHEGLVTISSEAFAESGALSQINIPSTVTSIGQDAFRYCHGLTEVDVPASVKTLYPGAFNSCWNLRKVTLHEGLETLGDGAFQYCAQLVDITIPNAVASIEHHTFRGCTKLLSVNLPAGLKKIDYEAFGGCTSLLSVSIPEGVTSIAYRAFLDCHSLTTVSLPSSLTTLGDGVFQNCNQLGTITLPADLQSIGAAAFLGCDALTSIYCLGVTPATINATNTFEGLLARAILYVKPAAESNYRTAARWNEFVNLQTFDNSPAAQPTFTLSNYSLSMATTTANATIYYTIDGSDPTTESTKYTAPIHFWQNGTVRAIAVKEGMDPSLVSEFKKEDLTVANPVVTMDENFKVTMTCEQPDIEGFPEVRVYYDTRNGYWDAHGETKLYDGEAIQLSKPTYIYVWAERDGWIPSAKTDVNFNSDYAIVTPSVEWKSDRQKAYVGAYDANNTYYYTLDGSEPTIESLVYNPNDSIAIHRNLTVKMLATRPGRFNSEIGSRAITDVNQTILRDGIYYRLVDNVLTNEVEVTRGTNAYTGHVNILETVKIDGVTYTVTRIGHDAFYNMDNLTGVTLPSTLTGIDYNAFYDCDNLTEVDIPAGVKSIGNAAFYSNNQLKTVTLHEGLERIGWDVFRETRITEITLPSTLTTIGDRAFQNADYLTNIVIPNSVTTLGAEAFNSCDRLETATLSSGLTTLSKDAFYNNPALYRVIVPEGITTIEQGVFAACPKLTTIDLPSTLRSIATLAFGSSTGLTSITIPEGVTEIAEKTFEYCSALTTVSLPSTLTTIGQYAFRNCSALTAITIPANVTSIGDYAFTGCTALTSVYTLATIPPSLSADGTKHAFANVIGQATLYTKTDAKEAYENKTPWDTFSTIASFDTQLTAQPTFSLNDFMLSIATATPGATIYYTRDNSEPTTESTKYTAPIPFVTNDTIRAMAVTAGLSPSVVADFRKNDYKVDVPTASLSDDLVMTIDCKVPNENVPATKIYYKLATLGQYNYGRWDEVEWTLYDEPVQLTAPRYVRLMATRDGWVNSDESGNYDYYSNYRLDAPKVAWTKDGTTGIGTITLSYNNASSEGDFYYTLDGTTPTKENGILYTEPFEVARNLTVKAVAAKDLHFYSDVTTYDVTDVSQTFYIDKVWYKLTANSLADEVEVTNGSIAYTGDVTIPATVTINDQKFSVVGIGNQAFNNQDNVTSVTLPSSIKYIGPRAFYDCANLANINIPEGVTAIGERAFYNCDNLTAIDIPASVKSIGEYALNSCDRLATVTLHEGLETMGQYCLASLPALKAIELPNSLTTLGNDIFNGCSNLSSVKLPATLTAIPVGFFNSCSALTTLTIPSTVKEIGTWAFYNCNKLAALDLPAGLETIGDHAFTECKSLPSITIPEGVKILNDNTFETCTSLASVLLPTGLERIGVRCFYNCPALATITLPANLKTIGAGAFASCWKLQTIYSQATTPATIEGNENGSYNYQRDAFSDMKQTATLYVGETSVATYKNATLWQQFSQIVGSDLTPCHEPTFLLADYKLTIQSLTEGAKIYYTNDGSDPDANAIPYSAPIIFTRNDTIRAVAIKDGMATSSIGEYRKNDFKVATPTATLSDDLVMTIQCEMPEATGMPETKVYYKLATYYQWNYGYWNQVEWQLYEGPVQLTEPRYVKLMATRDGWVTSNESSAYNYYSNYLLAQPTIKWDSDAGQFTITTTDADATIYYTLDGSEPSAENGTRYTEPVSLIRNLQVKAVATQDQHFNSTVSSVQVTGVNSEFVNDKLYYRLLDNTLANEVELIHKDNVAYSGDIVVPETVTNGGVDYTVVGLAADAFSHNEGLTSVSLPNTLRYINNWAFYNCDNLTRIEIPAGVKDLPYRAVSECDKLHEVVLHEGLETIGESAFNGNKALESINFPSTLTSIGNLAFNHCEKLKRVELPDAVQTIGEEAFRYCYSLEHIKLPAGLTEIARMAFAETAIMSIDIPATVQKIGSAAFGTCKSLRSVAIPEGVTEIADNTFDYCYALTTVELPSTLQKIGYRAFYQDNSLENLILPTSLTNIGQYAFAGCTAIANIYTLATTPPETTELPLQDCVNTATLYVPLGTETAYGAKAQWGLFNIKTFTAIPAAQPIFAYDNYKLQMSSKTDGVSIYYTRDGSDPTEQSLKYDTPIDLLTNDTIRAIAIGNGWGQSLVSEFKKNDFTVATPTSTISSDFIVTLDCEKPNVMGMPETEIYYSMNRSSYDPGETWTRYTEPFKMYQANYIHVKALRKGWTDSETIHTDYYNGYYLATPSISPTYTSVSYMPADSTITLTHSYNDVQLYYTLDGSDPNLNGTLYTGPIKAKHNVKVVVVAKREGSINSDPVTKEYNWFTASAPTITVEHLAAVMTSTNPTYATIYYTLDGTTPTRESKVYTEPVPLTADCYIKAIAIDEKWNDSQVGQYNNGSKYLVSNYTVATPTFSSVFETTDSLMTLTCTTPGATIYYTLDGTDPTDRSIKYEGKFKLVQNSTLKAIAMKEDMYNSAIRTNTIGWFQVEQPSIVFNGKFATITTNTANAVIYYTTDGNTPTTKSTPYQGQFELPAEQTTVRAIAVREDWNQSNAASRTYYTNNNYCEEPTLIRLAGTNKVQMSTRTEGSTIYYTTNGNVPTTNDFVYAGEPIEVDHNQTLKAMTTNPIYYESAVTTFEVNWFKVDQPVITTDGITASISCETPGAAIYYTTDGTEPTEYSTRYQGTFNVSGNCTIKALATYTDYTNSNVAQYVYSTNEHACAAPTYSRDGNTITLAATGDENTVIYYTTDGSTPTAQSQLYKQPLEVTENMEVRAIATNPHLFPSDVTTFAVNWFKAEAPTLTFDGIYLNMACTTPNARIYYTLDGSTPTEESLRYTETITMTGTTTIKAVALRDNFTNSDVVTSRFDEALNTVPSPQLVRDGKQLTLSVKDAPEGTVIYYTTDGEDPTTLSTVYTEPITPTENITVKAIATNPKLFQSAPSSYTIGWFKTEAPTLTFDGIYLDMACTTPNARIYYTLDGSTPTEESLRYTETITMTGTTTIKAVALRDNFTNSDVVTSRFDETLNTVPSPQLVRDGKQLTLSVKDAPEGTVIYYTTDGEDPTTLSTVYTEPITPTENITVKAIATNPKLFQSAPSSYTIGWFKAEAPAVTFDGILVSMECATPDARIYYTLDGSTPTEESLRYGGTLTMTESCTVKAIAVRENFTKSDVVTSRFDQSVNTLPNPKIERSGNVLTFSVTNNVENTTIYYTTDGTEPTDQSERYTAPITVPENMTIKALATNPKLFNSAVTAYEVDWFKVETPVITLDGKTAIISCATPDATIHYTLDGDLSATSAVYSGPLQLTDNREVKAYAVRKNYKDSETAAAAPDLFICDEVTFSYNGRYLQMQTGEGMSIHYTTDGSRPTEESAVYSEPVDISELCTVTAVAIRKDFRDSPATSYTVTYLYTGEEVSLEEPGHLEEVFSWSGGTANLEVLPVKGAMNAKDLAFIHSISSLRHLDLTDATFEGGKIPDEAFANMPLLSFKSPTQVTEVGKNLFKGCDDLAAIVWNANTTLPMEAIEDVKNPNLLLYVNSRVYMPTGYTGNLISGGQAESIILTDTETGGNFYCPEQFHARQISYTHAYAQPTETGVMRGWETLSLPFDVQTITHEKRGVMAPFAKGEDVLRYKPFWLYELTGTGFERAAEIKAYTPYIVSMPNNPNYADDYILAGRVTFAAQSVYVEADAANVAMKGSVRFTPSMQRQAPSGNVLVINLEDYTDTDGAFYVNGSAFLPNMREAHPFEACALVNTTAPKRNGNGEAEDGADDSGAAADGGAMELFSATALMLDELIWGSETDMQRVEMEQLEELGKNKGVYDMSGRKLGDDSSVLEDEKATKHKRVYIVNGKKVLVK